MCECNYCYTRLVVKTTTSTLSFKKGSDSNKVTRSLISIGIKNWIVIERIISHFLHLSLRDIKQELTCLICDPTASVAG